MALETISEPTWCAGEIPLSERLAIVLPDGDLKAVDEPGFVTWLREHAELAPFGHGSATIIDATVRNAYRLIDRGRVRVDGFDPGSVLPSIEAAMSPSMHLEAHLLDVLLYPVDGRFGRHQDTPYDPAFIGTLIVGLPIAHAGGALVIDDGRERREVDWTGTRDSALPWVAVFGDVDHEVKPVVAGARATLVYMLVQTDRRRQQSAADSRRDQLRDAITALEDQQVWPVMIACTRPVITKDPEQPQPITTLRGLDRELADLLSEAGYRVAVRACVVAVPVDPPPPRRPPWLEVYSVARLRRELPADVIAGLAPSVSFRDQHTSYTETSSLEPYIEGETDTQTQWVIRGRAAMTALRAAELADDGFFGNSAFAGFLYALAALEVWPDRVPM